MSVYTGSIPQPNDIPAQSQSLILQNFTYLSSTLGQDLKVGDHQIASGDLNTATFEGRHVQVCLTDRNVNFTPAPTVTNIADGADSVLYSSDGELYISSSWAPGKFFQLTTAHTLSPNADNNKFGTSTNGWTFLPGGLILQYGEVSSPGTSGSVVFASSGNINFPNAIFHVYLSLEKSNANEEFTYENPSTTGFDYNTTSSGGSTILHWLALGN